MSSQRQSTKVSSVTKQHMLENIFAISRDPTTITLLEAPTGRFAEDSYKRKKE